MSPDDFPRVPVWSRTRIGLRQRHLRRPTESLTRGQPFPVRLRSIRNRLSAAAWRWAPSGTVPGRGEPSRRPRSCRAIGRARWPDGLLDRGVGVSLGGRRSVRCQRAARSRHPGRARGGLLATAPLQGEGLRREPPPCRAFPRTAAGAREGAEREGEPPRQPDRPRRQPGRAEVPAADLPRQGEVRLHRPALQHRQRALGRQRQRRPSCGTGWAGSWTATT